MIKELHYYTEVGQELLLQKEIYLLQEFNISYVLIDTTLFYFISYFVNYLTIFY